MYNPDIISPPHIHDGSSVFGMMSQVYLALIPGLICYVIYFGWGIVIQCLMSIGFALVLEWVMLKLRKRPVELFLKDGSAIVTALLFAFTVSPFTPWWVNFTGIFFAIVFAKHLYGGLGHNPFNPAMAGYVFILLCYPTYMTLWPSAAIGTVTPDISDYLEIIFMGKESVTISIDAISGATVLDNMKSQLGLSSMISEIRTDPNYSTLAGRGWDMVNLSFLVGGVFMMLGGVIYWRLTVSTLAGLFIISLLFYISDGETYASPIFHLFAGGSMLAAFFIVTDPVTAPTTVKGRISYGLLIGILAYIIRVWGGYPDGFAFAVLLANAANPVISHYTTPRVLGEEEG